MRRIGQKHRLYPLFPAGKTQCIDRRHRHPDDNGTQITLHKNLHHTARQFPVANGNNSSHIHKIQQQSLQ